MTKDELSRAVELAKTKAELPQDLSIFDGFGLPDFQPVHTTIDAVAALIRWQCQCLYGGFDLEALNEVAYCGRRKFLII